MLSATSQPVNFENCIQDLIDEA
jgi:hypothetical protein